jgi:hypothetical protein
MELFRYFSFSAENPMHIIPIAEETRWPTMVSDRDRVEMSTAITSLPSPLLKIVGSISFFSKTRFVEELDPSGVLPPVEQL